MVLMQDIRATCLCAGGARAFAKRHGLDWSQFLKEGVPAEVLLRTGDWFAQQVVENARARWAADQKSKR